MTKANIYYQFPTVIFRLQALGYYKFVRGFRGLIKVGGAYIREGGLIIGLMCFKVHYNRLYFFVYTEVNGPITWGVGGGEGLIKESLRYYVSLQQLMRRALSCQVSGNTHLIFASRIY